MTLKKRFALFGATALLGLFSLCALQPAQAQAPTPPINPFQNFNIPPSLFFGMMGQGGIGGIDPTHSSAMQLLQRNDVRNEIGFDLKQQNTLEQLRTKSQQDFQKKITTTVQESAQALKDVPQEEQLNQIQDRMNQFATTLQNFQGDVDKQTEAILREKQLTRLHELDLRWRGPLALSDPKVATTLKLTPEQTNSVTTTMKEFMDAQQKALMQVVMSAMAPQRNDPNAPPVSQQERAQQMQKKVADALHSREMEKTKAATEAKLLELLTPEQKTQWTTMLGAKFTFRQTEVP